MLWEFLKKPQFYDFYIICNADKMIGNYCGLIFFLKKNFAIMYILTIDILFLSNHNIHKSLCGLCFEASDPLIERDH